jgi:transposase-like protein
VEQLTLSKLPKYLSDESSAWELLERLRWPGGMVACPHCGAVGTDHYLIPSRSGERRTKKGTVTHRRLWRCIECKKQFSVLVGTIFESSKVPASKWLLAMWLMAAGKNGVSSKELQRHLEVSYQTAWHMSHRLREAMTREPLRELWTGTVVADETYVGGAPKNKHANKRRPDSRQGVTDKTPVVALVHKRTGEVRAKVVPNVTSRNLATMLNETCSPEATHLHTDSAGVYAPIGPDFASHETVNHSVGEYVRDGISTNQAESFFAQFKRSLDGTHHSVSKEHLQQYASEFEFRWNTSKVSDPERVQALVDGAVGKRLPYRPLIARPSPQSGAAL